MKLMQRASLGLRRRNSAVVERPDEPELVDPDARLQAQWTGGSQLATKAATAGLWSALLAGPLALALATLAFLSSGTQPAPAVAPAPVQRAGEQAAVEEFAGRFVVTWLQTRRGDEEQLSRFVSAASFTLPEVPWVATQADTAEISRIGEGVWAVTVGVTVTPPKAAKAVPGGPTRRYFQVPVQYAAGALVAQTLPAPVSQPASAAGDALNYRYRTALTDPAAAAVQDFLAALLTGTGDVTRYVTPGVSIAAITPPPYTDVAVTDVLADQDLTGEEASSSPPPGGQLRVMATASAAANARQETTVQYALTLASRAGRWEVRSVDPTPAVRPRTPDAPDPSTSTTPTTTGANTIPGS